VQACVLAIATTASTWSGNRMAHSKACIPPSEPPATAGALDTEGVKEGPFGPYHVATVITGSLVRTAACRRSVDDGPVVPGSRRAGS